VVLVGFSSGFAPGSGISPASGLGEIVITGLSLSPNAPGLRGWNNSGLG